MFRTLPVRALGIVLSLLMFVGNVAAQRDSNLAMGNPSGATTSTANPNNYLMSKTQYSLSYNKSTAIPNWTSWHLNSSWLGSTPRTDAFAQDSTLPSGWYRVGSSSYSGSGFDRGHMCPSADRTSSSTDNRATFLMTNMVPQAPNNNQRGWARLEDYGRTLVSSGQELYIIAGSVGIGGSGSSGYKTSVDSGRVRVPNKTWKVILVLSNGSNDAARVTTSTRTIAIIMPNDQSVINDWKPYRTSVDAVESLTGYNFFTAVPTSIQSVIEARVDNQ